MTGPIPSAADRPVRVALDRAAMPSSVEVAYVVRTLLRSAGFATVIEWADASDEPVDIAYGEAAWHRAAIRIPAVSWAFHSAVDREPSSVVSHGGAPLLLFPGERMRPAHEDAVRFDFPVDILFGSYWWLTGAREASYRRDRFDNLHLDGSVVVSHGLLGQPSVSLVAAAMGRRLRLAGLEPRRPGWLAAGRQAAFAFTHDVDYPEIIRWIEVPRVLASRGARGLRLALDVASGRSHFWTFREWVDFAASLGTRPAFYFMARKGSLLQYAMGTPDDFYDVASPRFARLFAELREAGCEVGLHASYRAHSSVGQLQRERQRIETVAGVSGIGNRHHYWHLDPDDPNETLRRHELAGLRYDSSLGYEFYPGFRRGICHPFRVFHPGERRELDIVQLPPAWMDDHFGRRLTRNGIDDPVAAARNLLDAARATGGVAVVDYHSRGMNADFYPQYGPWLQRFAVEHLDSTLAYHTPDEIRAMYLEHVNDLDGRSEDRLLAATAVPVSSPHGRDGVPS